MSNKQIDECLHDFSSINQCIGCGCDELHACLSTELPGPCHWLRLNAGMGLGVCSACPGFLQQWQELYSNGNENLLRGSRV